MVGAKPFSLLVRIAALIAPTVVESRITYIDGDNGILRYRGIPIEQLAENSTHLETAYLVLYGELPSKSQYAHFEREIMHHTFTHEDLNKLVGAFRYDAHPMAVLTSSFAALGACEIPFHCRNRMFDSNLLHLFALMVQTPPKPTLLLPAKRCTPARQKVILPRWL